MANKTDKIHSIFFHNTLICMIVRDHTNSKSNFITPDDQNVQVGFIVYPKGSEINKHIHKKLNRQIEGTFEVLLIKRGKCIVDVYNDNKEYIESQDLGTGDILIMFNGGHGFKMLEDTEILEVKQGPYYGMDEKELF